MRGVMPTGVNLPMLTPEEYPAGETNLLTKPSSQETF